jgi:hypothetical protein
MKKAISAKQKSRGRPATGITPMMGFRADPVIRAEIVRWAENQRDMPSLSEAIRRLVEIGLSRSPPKKPRVLSTAKQGAERAVELAADAIGNQMPDTSNEEKATRRRRLIKGPAEFRNVRRDRPGWKPQSEGLELDQ